MVDADAEDEVDVVEGMPPDAVEVMSTVVAMCDLCDQRRYIPYKVYSRIEL